MTIISNAATSAGLPNAALFTTHCFQRGGAQYWFMFAPIGKCWTLARIQWWGGWADGEHVYIHNFSHGLTLTHFESQHDTLIQYLLDELYTYEEDHIDALCPIQCEVDKSHAGKAALVRPLCTEEARHMFEMHATHTRAAVREATFSAISTISGVFSQADNSSLTPLYNLTTLSQYNRTIPQLSVFPPSCPSYLSTDRRGVLVPLPLASFQQTPHKPSLP
jgi:hypothetical protein